MITREQALAGSEWHDDGSCPRNPDGRGRDKGPTRWRRNGATQTWKTRPADYRLPVKHGMRDYSSISPEWNCVHTVEDCPRNV